MEITLHHLEASRSQRIVWLLEELGLQYQIVRYQRNPQTMLAPPELTLVHPLGKSPVVTVQEGQKTITLAESGAIIEYFCRHFLTPNGESLVPPLDTQEQRQYTFWLHFAEGSAMPMLLLKLIFDKIEQGPWLVRPILKQVSHKVKNQFILPTLLKQASYIDAQLEHGAWLIGKQFTAADIQMSYVIEGLSTRLGLTDYPNIKAYFERLQQRQAYIKALKEA